MTDILTEVVAKSLCRLNHGDQSIDELVAPDYQRWQRFQYEASVVLRDLAEEYAIVKLAEPTDVGSDGDEYYYSDGSAATAIWAGVDHGVVYQGNWEWTTDQAMEVGRQWISAAMVAGPNRTVNA